MIRIGIGLALSVVLGWNAAAARTIRVERDGSGDVIEIHDAIASAAPGDTVRIGPGRWDLQREFSISGSATPVMAIARVNTSDLTILGAGVGQTIVGPVDPVQPVSPGGTAGFLVDLGGVGCVIRGVTFTNLHFPVTLWARSSVVDCAFVQPFSLSAPALAVIAAPDVVVTDCVFATPDGIGIFGGAERPRIERCRFDDATFEGTGVYVSWEGLFRRPEPGEVGVIRDCVFDRIGVAVQTGFDGDVRVENCEVLRAEGLAFYVPDASMQIVGCTVRPTPRYVVAATSAWNVEVRDSQLAGGQIVTIHDFQTVRFVVTDCNIVETRSKASWNQSYLPGQVLDLRENWWDTTDRAEIQRRTRDEYGRTILFPARTEPVPGFESPPAPRGASVEADATFESVRARANGLPPAEREWSTVVGTFSSTANPRVVPPPTELEVYRDPGFVWIDEDMDGGLDLVASGYGYEPRRIYAAYRVDVFRNLTTSWRNDGSLGLPGRAGTGLRFVDWDRDGALDAVTTTSGGFVGVWRREADHFVESMREGGFALASLDVGDLDRDGDPDALVAGHGRRPVWFENVAGDVVVHELPLPMLSDAIVALFDADVDGDLDGLLMGWDGYDRRAFLLANDGAGGLAAVEHPFPALNMGDVETGDVDGDGDPDVALMGLTVDGPVTGLYRNEGTLRFSRIDVALPQLYDGGLDFGDVDNDGDLDLALSGGDTQSRPVTRILLNGGSVWPNAQPILTGLRASDLEWGDVDADGKLDLVYGGIDATPDLRTYVLGNVLATRANEAPSAPARPIVVRDGDEVVFTWDRSVDDRTPVASLTYELWVGTSASTADIVPVAARLSDGLRRMPRPGNMAARNEHRLRIPRDVEVHAGVQAIDAGLRASAFAEFGVLPADGDTVEPVGTTDVDRSVRLRRLPASGATEVSYLADAGVRVRIAVYDVRGRRVDVVADELGTGERRTVTWNADARAGGVYFVRVRVGDLVRTFKTSIVR